jgi:TrmH family RNA methyltransferase
MVPAVARGDATFQVLDALGRNRRKRRQRREFLVHGVRSIDAAMAAGWPFTRVVVAEGRSRSRWADRVLAAGDGTPVVELPVALFDALAQRDEPGELIAVAELRTRPLTDVDAGAAGPVVVLDRPSNPGNLGTVIRSADAFGAAAVVVLGHAADPFDPRAVRASVGSLFAVPLVEAGGAGDLTDWLRGSGRRAVGLDESGSDDMSALRGEAPVAIVLGNEGRGLGAAARDLCDDLVRIPMRTSTATSLNLAVAASIALYELAR